MFRGAGRPNHMPSTHVTNASICAYEVQARCMLLAWCLISRGMVCVPAWMLVTGVPVHVAGVCAPSPSGKPHGMAKAAACLTAPGLGRAARQV
mmetsp:Transcript_18824/g.56863  ORF Transcript_18824/g.56863 Transcript_18824/m.56863 type:complete len:93 (-) Transcript_18824:107-385(-)